MPVSRADLMKELLPALNALFDEEYLKYRKVTYTAKYNYGKYRIYKTEWDEELKRPQSTTLARGLTKEEAIGMMKLLKEDDDE